MVHFMKTEDCNKLINPCEFKGSHFLIKNTFINE